MVYSYTQIAQYLRCPRSYRYRYLDGWQEKDSRSSLLFGRCFEKAVAAMFLGEDSTAVLFREWGDYRSKHLEYKGGESWEKILRQGIRLLERLAQDARVDIHQPQKNLQLKLSRKLTNGNEFIAYIDAIGDLDGRRCLLEWKTTAARYPEQPKGLLGLDPQLICYSWMSGISEVGLVAFVRKQMPEIQYLSTTITEKQRQEFSQLVDLTIPQIESGHFPAHSGIRFPQNGCTSCAHLGHCLGDEHLVANRLIRRPGADDLDWLDQLEG